jgi:tRNA (guanine-N7-)-methyltransferase
MSTNESGKRKNRKRVRAHANPLAMVEAATMPANPLAYDWHAHFPLIANAYDPSPSSSFSDASTALFPTIADIGCGFGGLLKVLSPVYPSELIIGCEIREACVSCVEEDISEWRVQGVQDAKHSSSSSSFSSHSSSSSPDGAQPFQLAQNVSVLHINIMKSAPYYFRKDQFRKLFILFPDPHFKKNNHRRRVINQGMLSLYAFMLREGGLLYTITDVQDLHEWMVKHLDEHPSVARVPLEELADDPAIECMTNGTNEGQKVSRLHGSKYPAVYRRVPRA